MATSNIVPPFYETMIVAGVALSLAIAPLWADLGMRLSRKIVAMRTTETAKPANDTPSADGPVVIFGMTDIGRLAADALRENDIQFLAIDNDPDRFVSASADGYDVLFGNAANMNFFSAITGRNACAVVVGAPNYTIAKSVQPTVQAEYPDILRFVSLQSQEAREQFGELGFRAWLSRTTPPGVEMVADLLQQMDVDDDKIADWLKTISERYHIEDRSEEIVTIIEEEAAEAA